MKAFAKCARKTAPTCNAPSASPTIIFARNVRRGIGATYSSSRAACLVEELLPTPAPPARKLDNPTGPIVVTSHGRYFHGSISTFAHHFALPDASLTWIMQLETPRERTAKRFAKVLFLFTVVTVTFSRSAGSQDDRPNRINFRQLWNSWSDSLREVYLAVL